MAGDKLTPKQETYCQERFVNKLSQRQAYKKAFDAKNMNDNTIDRRAFELEQNGKIKAREKELNDKVLNKNLVTKEYVIEALMEVAERCMQKVPVLDTQGEPTGEWKFEAAGANKSLELLGKTIALFTDKTESINLNADIQLTPEERQKRIEELKAKL